MPEELKDQIDAMLNIGESTAANDEVDGVDEAAETDEVDSDKTDGADKSDESDSSEEGETDELDKTEDKSATEEGKLSEETEPSEPPEEDELEKIKKENEALRRQVADAYDRKIPISTPTPTSTQPGADVPNAPKPTDEDIDFLGDEFDPDDLTRDSNTLNKILNKVYKMGSDVSRNFQETTLRNIPDIVKSNVFAQATLKKKVDEFYTDNKDLKPFKKAVAAVYEELASENPGWELDKIFTETEKETRNRLELQKEAGATSASTTSAPKGPRFPKTKTSRSGRQKPNTSHLLTEIDKMNESL